MGAMGRYIAALDECGRDRLIVAEGWITSVWFNDQGARCLIGHGEDFNATNDPRDREDFEQKPVVRGLWAPEVYHAFDQAVRRWPERTVRAVKLRAARLNGTDASQIAALLAQTTPTPTKAEVES